MNRREDIYLLASATAPVATVAFIFSFAASDFFLAWTCALLIVLLMETRAQAGERLPRTRIFWMHLSSAVPFFLALTALAFFRHPLLLIVFTAMAGTVAFYTGGILWYRGLQTRVLHFKT